MVLLLISNLDSREEDKEKSEKISMKIESEITERVQKKNQGYKDVPDKETNRIDKVAT